MGQETRPERLGTLAHDLRELAGVAVAQGPPDLAGNLQISLDQPDPLEVLALDLGVEVWITFQHAPHGNE